VSEQEPKYAEVYRYDFNADKPRLERGQIVDTRGSWRHIRTEAGTIDKVNGLGMWRVSKSSAWFDGLFEICAVWKDSARHQDWSGFTSRWWAMDRVFTLAQRDAFREGMAAGSAQAKEKPTP
jgi:hypothetical protein